MHLHLVRLTLETESPLSIGSGRVLRRPRKEAGSEASEEHSADAIVRDANGLPTIPGSSYQGVLRLLARKTMGSARTDAVFGRSGDRPENGQVGTVICGWGHVHDADDAVVNPMPGMPRRDDPVLRFLGEDAPLWRDHVALSHRLSVDNRKKFARAAVPRGVRFSLELARFGHEDDKTLIEVAALFRHPEFRLGSARNRGYGRLNVLRASHACVGLDDPERLRQLRISATHIPFEYDLMNDPCFESPAGETTEVKIRLVSDGFLRMGAATDEAISLTEGSYGARSLRDGTDPRFWEDEPQRAASANVMRILTEPVVVYPSSGSQKRAEVLTAKQLLEADDPSSFARIRFPVPGSQLRQPIAHRALFHWNRASGRCVDAEAYDKADVGERELMVEAMKTYAMRSGELARFFGSSKGLMANGARSPGIAGSVLVDDTEISAQWVITVDHNSIDRFTGGVRDRTGVLYSEEVLYRAELSILLKISEGPETDQHAIGGWSINVADAFLKALRDLCCGRLPIGARSLGVCSGEAQFTGRYAAAWQSRASAVALPLAKEKGAR